MTTPCASCGQPVLAGMRFCGHCGTAVAAWWTCASCEGDNPSGTRFCGHCGRAAATGSSTAAPADVSETLRSFVAGQVAERLVEAGGAIPEERRLVTALFADVSGFTTLADKLDPEALLEVIDPLISALTDVVGRYEGYVEKFAGDALLALFGAPVSHEDDAQRALHVALEMHRELERVREELGPSGADLALHVGVNSGHAIARVMGSAVRMDYAVLGDSIILAQRLESAAPRGETYVSELTYRLARDDFELEPVGELTLKGKLEPVPAWRLLGARTAGSRRAVRAEASSPLVGRERELELVEEELAALDAGRGTAVGIVGEPGVGKSRLTAEVRARSERAGRRWLETRCLSYGAALAYWPYAELLRAAAGIAPDDGPEGAGRLLETAVGAGPELAFFARLLDAAVADPVPETLEPEAFRRGLHDAFVSWLRSVAGETPVVVAIEDLHWADASSRALTAELARRCADVPVALYAIVRPEGVEAVPEGARHVTLGPLDADGVRRLVAATLGAEPPGELPAAVAERTGGNPFFAEELVRALRETGDLERADGRWRMRAGWSADAVPPTVEGLLAARLDLLPRAAATLLQTAAVIGRRIPLELLEAVAGESGASEQALEPLVAGAFLDRFAEDGHPGVAFHHALVQEVAYARLLRRQQRDLHRRVAEVAESLYGSGDDVVALLARHLYLGEADKAVEYLVRAGRRARALYANAEAIEHLGRAAELAPAGADVRLELAELHELVGDYDDALRLYGEARDAGGAVRAWAGLASTLRKQGEYARALRVVEEAFASEGLRGSDLSPLWLEQARTLSASGRLEQAVEVLEAGLAASGGARGEVAGQMLLQLAGAEISTGRVAEGLAHALEAQRLLDAAGDPRGQAAALRILGSAYKQLGELEQAADALRRGLAAAERVGGVEEIGGCLINLGLVELERGALDEAIACDRRAAEEFERIGHGAGRAIAYGNLAEKLLRAGSLDDAGAHAERALAVAEEIGHRPTTADATRTLAAIALARGRHEDAAARAEEAAGLFAEMGAGPGAAAALELAAEAWRLAGDGDRADDAENRARSLETAPAG